MAVEGPPPHVLFSLSSAFHLRERGWATLGFPHLVMVSSLFQNLFQNRSDITLLKTIFTVGIEYHTVLVVITDRYLE